MFKSRFRLNIIPLMFFIFSICTLVFFTTSDVKANTVTTRQENRPSQLSLQHAKQVSNACIGKWKNQECLASISQTVLDTVSDYGEQLKSAGKNEQLSSLVNQCAASTAALEDTYPAYAMESAWRECANTISDIHDVTGIMPDASMYQLLLAGIWCLSEDQNCRAVEAGLQAYK